MCVLRTDDRFFELVLTPDKNHPIIQKYHIICQEIHKRTCRGRVLFMTTVHQKIQKTDCPLWTFAFFGDIIKTHVNNYIFYVKLKEEQENGKKNEDHGR